MLSANLVLRAQLAEIDASIAVLKSRLKSLERLRQPLQKELNHRGNPVLSLPPEITSEIFLHCVPAPSPLDSLGKPNPTKNVAPLLLLQVCRTWRQIALSTPHLWAALHLDLGLLIVKMSDAAVEKVIMDWFGRAGTSPLAFSVRMRKGWGVFNGAISSVLLALRPRLQSICLQLQREHFELLADIGPFPILEDLAIGIPWSENDGSMKIFSSAPLLRRVFFSELAKPSMFILPHKNISQVMCPTPFMDDFLDFLQNYPLVKEFTGFVGDTSRTEFITHTHLESLCLTPGSGTAFLRLLQLPALRQLTLSTDLEDADGYYDDDINLDYLNSFLASTSLRSFCATRNIGLSLDLFTTGMTGLVDIDLCDPQPPFLSQFFAKLDRKKDDRFLPHLRALVFRKCDVSLDPAMLQVLSSRCTANEGSAVLESFQLIWSDCEESDGDSDYHSDSDSAFPRDDPHFVDDATTSACREMVKRGMSIHVGPAGRNWIL